MRLTADKRVMLPRCFSLNMFHRLGGLVFLLCIGGCSSTALVVGKPGDAVAVEEVVVFFARRPDCAFETIAHLKMENPYYSLQALVVGMRQQAAELGADALLVEQTRRLPGREYVGTGRAIRCTDQRAT